MIDARILAPLLVSFAWAGCVGQAGPDTASTAGTSPTVEAAPPVATSDLGSLSGVVVDEQIVPVSNVTILVASTDRKTLTDASGKYTFNELDPGPYVVQFTKIGYDPVAKKADVVAGGIAWLNATLRPLSLDVAYQWTIPRTSFVKFGQWTVNHVQQTLNQTSLNQQLCETCWHVFEMPPKVVDGLTEIDWLPSVSSPVTNAMVGIGISKVWGDGTLTSYFIIKDFLPRERYHWTSADVGALKGAAKIRLNVQGPGAGHPGIVFQQKVDVWSTFSLVEPIDGNFTAMPPK